jgi:glycosyltransferase A (GT-A) superfamily protein (DUF2064 family)
MKTGTSNIAILFFSRSAKEEAMAKNWLKDKDPSINVQIAQQLIDQSKLAIQKSGLPVFSFDSSKQIGSTFGERLANAFEQVFHNGYDAVISVGNDSPQLNEINWAEIIKTLQSGQNVLGPSNRGGAYLIGMTKKTFRYYGFIHLPWKKSHLFNALNNFLKKNDVAVKLLPKYRDINSWYDLILLRNELSQNPLLKLLRNWIFSNDSYPFSDEVRIIKNFPIHHFGLRAPPAIVLHSQTIV